MNPLANGRKTINGVVGIVLVTVIVQLLKQAGIDDPNAILATQLAGYVLTGGLAVWGIIHKWIKHQAKKKSS